MRHLMILLILFGTTTIKAAKYERTLEEIAIDLAQLVEQRGFEKIAIWNFQPVHQSEDHISKPLTEDFSVFFTNATPTLKIYDRQHIESLTDELKLQQSGLMDPKTAKDIGSFTGVEAIVTGNYAFNKNKLKLWIKVIETESAFQIAMKNTVLPWQDKTYIQKNKIKSITAPSRTPSIHLGQLKIINKKTSHLKVVLSNGTDTKTAKVAGKSKIDVMNLPNGIYNCEIFYASGDLFQKYDVKVGPRKKRLRIRSKNSLFRFF